ncbi:MAG: sensor histidine kinase [Proteobacteria bacterium]|nr:sensor histidine kinase [Pseudomonadota bacterium]
MKQGRQKNVANMQARNVDKAVDALLVEAVTKTERAISWARIIWGSILVAFTISTWEYYGLLSISVAIPPIVLFVLLSTYFIWMLHRRPMPRWLTPVSVTMDCMVSFLMLLPVVLWPYPGYPGMINIVDISGMLIPVFAAGFRLSTKVAVWGSVLGMGTYMTLMTLDRLLNDHPRGDEMGGAVLFLIYMLGCAILAIVLARHTRSLVRRSAHEAVRSNMAKSALDNVMQGHHDMRSMLTSATVGVDILADRLKDSSTGTEDQVAALTQKLQDDLERVNRSVSAIKGEALSELMSLKERERADLSEALVGVLSRVSQDFPGVIFDSTKTEAAAPFLTGGQRALERILFNLFVNACEGDGETGARLVEISASVPAPGDRVIVAVSDDGPGFPPEMLESTEDKPVLSRKPGGSGIGLLTVRGLVRASEGTLRLENNEGFGATVFLELPLR